MPTTASSRLLNRYFILVWIVALTLNLTQNMLNNAVALYVTSLGMSTGFAGLLGIPYAIAAIAMRFIGGSWIDRHSRRSLMITGCVAFALSAVLFGAIPAAWALLLFRGVHGFSYSSGQLAASTANVDVTPPDRRNLGIGIFWVSSAVSLGCAGYIVTSLTSGGSYWPLFLTCGLISLIGGAVAMCCSYEKKTRGADTKASAAPSAYRGLLRYIEPKAFRPAMLMFMEAVGISCVALYLLVFAREMEYDNAGLALVMATLGMAVGNLSSDRLVHKLGARNTLIVTFLVSALGFSLMVLVRHYATYLAGGVVYGFLQGVCLPVFSALAVKDMPAERRGVAGGTVYCMLDLGMGIGTAMWGVVIGAFGFTVCFLSASAVLLAAVLLTYLFYRKE